MNQDTKEPMNSNETEVLRTPKGDPQIMQLPHSAEADGN